MLIVGAGIRAKKIAFYIRQEQEYGFKLAGFVDDAIDLNVKIFENYKVLGNIQNINNIVIKKKIDEIIIAIDDASYEMLHKIIDITSKVGKHVDVVSDLYDVIPKNVSINSLSNIPLVRVSQEISQYYYLILKRYLDLVGSFAFFCALSPIIVFSSLLIKLTSSGPIFFKQERIGKDGKLFTIYKFRTMYANNDDKSHKLFTHNFIKNGNASNGIYKIIKDKRVTPLGRLLRKTSIDELPQLINVMKGEMSLVGPRPCLPYELELYDGWHKKRIKSRPGCTGLWQVSGRSSVSFNDMVVMDLYYIDNISLWFDIQIMLKTIPVLLFGKGAH